MSASAVAVDRRHARAPISALIATAALGATAAVATAVFVSESPIVHAPATTAIVKGLLVASYVAIGTYTWWRRPGSRLGAQVATVGFLYAATALAASTEASVFTAGRVALAVLVAYFVRLVLCFPRDRAGSALERRYVAAFAVGTAVVWVVVLALARTLPRGGAFTDCVRRCPENPLRVVDTSQTVTHAINLGATAATALGLAGVIVLLVRKGASPPNLRRRAMMPLLFAAATYAAGYAGYSLIAEAGGAGDRPGLRILSGIGALAVPVALLVGQVRGRIFAATNLWRMLSNAGGRGISPVWIEHVLATALGDPSFALAVWEPQRAAYVDSHGEFLQLPGAADARSVTEIEMADRPALALLHDPALNDDREIVEGLGATAAMLLDNARLVEEVQASRARIVHSVERERLRLERDLHDGAQQRLMSIQIKLALAREDAHDPALAAQLDELAADASAAVAELRSLAHGIYPSVLRERGVGDALRAFAPAVPIPVEVVDRGIGRAPSGVEAAIYYCSLEAIQNIVKHAGDGTTATVTLGWSDGRIMFAVSDDGVGFDPAAHADGIGLVTMHDRVAAVGGQLNLTSSDSGGTTVAGSFPVAGDAVLERPERELRP